MDPSHTRRGQRSAVFEFTDDTTSFAELSVEGLDFVSLDSFNQAGTEDRLDVALIPTTEATQKK